MTEAVREGTRLLHVGPHKTGTTTLQAAMHNSRRQLARSGVHYAGPDRQPMAAALAAASMNARAGQPAGRIQPWHDLLTEVRKTVAPRVVISSEFFANAGPEAAQRTVDDLDPARVHVAITLRPLARILPSQWQQYVQNRLTTCYDDWLDAMFNQPPYVKPTPTFWRRHRHDLLVTRWAQAAGAENVTVVVVDDHDHTAVLHSFEDLLAVTRGTLQPPERRANRSLTVAETSVLRAFNEVYDEAELPDALYQSAVRFGAARYLAQRRPDDDEQRITTPAWALERVAAMVADTVDVIAASGVRVVGDLARLTDTGEVRADGDTMETVSVSPELAARAAIGVALAMHADDVRTETAQIRDLSNSQLLRIVARRTRTALRPLRPRR